MSFYASQSPYKSLLKGFVGNVNAGGQFFYNIGNSPLYHLSLEFGHDSWYGKLKQENDEQVEWFLEKYPDVKQKYRFQLVSDIVTTADTTRAIEIRKLIKENGGYCPCSLIKDDDHECMCKEFREIEEGTCRCGLYNKIPILYNDEALTK